MALIPGKCSIFVREDSLYHACGSDGQCNIQLATVETDSVTRVQIDIIYNAISEAESLSQSTESATGEGKRPSVSGIV
ncbi:MAG: hypothetical protein JSU73_09030 [candidate division WOR-3 bacterium]|nr:MAG: hypothetical protein JSU73_09030 [candidate division WOR-3 bacterium]